MKHTIVLFLALLLVIPFSLAHGDEQEEKEMTLEEIFREKSLFYVTIASIISALIVSLSIYLGNHFPDKFKNHKGILFIGIIIPILLATGYMVTGTIYLNVISQSGGPVHWHADFEIYNCGDKIDIINPEGLANRVGTSSFHEHNDNRIHVEGVVVDDEDVTLHHFFRVIGGELTQNKITVPTDEGMIEINDKGICDGKEGRLQVFVYNTIEGRSVQQKLENFEDYTLSPYSNVPPGDCIIIEFGPEKESTDKICETYKIALEKGELIGG